MKINTIINKDWIAAAKELPDGCVHTIITSPPYWNQRDYGADGQLGLEATFEEHIQNLVVGFREMRRILRDDGTIWVNYGDKFIGGGNGGGNKNDTNVGSLSARTATGLSQGNVIGLAWRLAFALQADGWILRDDVIWAKAISSFGMHVCPHCGKELYQRIAGDENLFGEQEADEVVNHKKSGSTMPESMAGTRWERCRVKVKDSPMEVKDYGVPGSRRNPVVSGGFANFVGPAYKPCPGCDKCRANGGYVLRRGSWRCTRAHEYVFQFVKQIPYFSDMEAVKEEYAESSIADKRDNTHGQRRNRNFIGQAQQGGTNLGGNRNGGRNLRDVWTINPQPNGDQMCLNCNYIFSGRSKKRIKKVDGKQQCPECGAIDKWSGHYATFPEALVEPCIKVSTSEKGVCPKCGSQWARVIESKQIKRKRPEETAITKPSKDRRPSGNAVAAIETTTLGWKPTCDCNAGDPVPAVVWDPFSGTSTVAVVAAKLGRNYGGSEISKAYLKFAEAKILQAETGISIADAQSGQMAMEF
ncbi:MAG TPA: hypothetical protein HPP87_10000 [Planctomycetes bacterium]|nr:hypothetical protein [Planctomycetota bacterium]